MQTELVGRIKEKEILERALASDSSEMVAVFGRRRVGKTFLIKQTYKDNIVFELSGLQNATSQGQLQNFMMQVTTYLNPKKDLKTPKNWLEAFFLLATQLDQLPDGKKKVVFLDELPWLALPKSDFIMGLGWFWNSWAEMKNMVVVICGSAASWMINNIVNDRGGLHNRITKRVFLDPFSLQETEKYLKSRQVNYNHHHILQIYMALGGIPHYLKEVEPGKSAIQNINDICFSRHGLLYDEFERLYPALFANSTQHILAVRALAQSHQGLTREGIVKAGKLPNGGNTTKVLEELKQSGFITSFYSFKNRKKEKLFRLTDEYSLFYLRFIEHQDSSAGNDVWNHLSQTQSAKIWAGYAFENVCLKHISAIKKALGISGIYSEASSFYKKGTEQEDGAQIDLVLDRKDSVINLFEIKYYDSVFSLTEAGAKALRQKIAVFREVSGTKKYLMPVLIATNGIKHNMHSLGLIEATLTLEDIFG